MLFLFTFRKAEDIVNLCSVMLPQIIAMMRIKKLKVQNLLRRSQHWWQGYVWIFPGSDSYKDMIWQYAGFCGEFK